MIGPAPLTKEVNKIIRTYDLCYMSTIPRAELENCKAGSLLPIKTASQSFVLKASGILFKYIQVYRYAKTPEAFDIAVDVEEIRKVTRTYFGKLPKETLPFTYLAMIEPYLEYSNSNASFVSFTCSLEDYNKTWLLVE